ncbi:hypothetical protein SUDANB28_03617 [Streptomyces sp. enrichment culture]
MRGGQQARTTATTSKSVMNEATVGLATVEAERTGRRVDVVDHDMRGVAGARQYGEDYRGRARMLVR